jgi:hypothetical protein
VGEEKKGTDMTELFKQLAEALKLRLRERKEDWADVNDWNGDTEAGFYTTTEIDMKELDAQIDALCQEFAEKQKVKP